MNQPLTKSIRRILIALGEEGEAAGTFEFTASLAQTLDAELRGLFVEDADLLRLAGLPFARETGTTTAVTRRLQHPDVERSWRRQATRLQKNLVEAAIRRQLRWSFQVVRGRMTTQVMEEATTTDLVAVTSATRSTAELLRVLRCPVVLLPQGAMLGSPVGVIVDDSPESDSALRFAATLSSVTDNESLQVFIVAAAGTQERVVRRVDSYLAGTGVHGHTQLLTAPDTEVLIRRVQGDHIRTLVVAASTIAQWPWLRSLLDRPPCAIWMTR